MDKADLISFQTKEKVKTNGDSVAPKVIENGENPEKITKTKKVEKFCLERAI